MLPAVRNIQSCNIMVLIRIIVEFSIELNSHSLIISFDLSNTQVSFSILLNWFWLQSESPGQAIKSMQPWLPGSFIEADQLIFHKKLMRATTRWAWSLQERPWQYLPASELVVELKLLKYLLTDKVVAGSDIVLSPSPLVSIHHELRCVKYNYNSPPPPPPVISYYHYQPHNCHTTREKTLESTQTVVDWSVCWHWVPSLDISQSSLQSSPVFSLCIKWW